MQHRAVAWPKKGGIWNGLALMALGMLLVGWLLSTPPGLLGKADAIGYAVCHRIDLRSFHLGERPLPLCARCSGMYLGALLGLAYQGYLKPRRAQMPHRSVWLVIALLAVAFVVDGLNSFASLLPGAPGLYPPRNALRLLSGTGMGIAIAAALYPALNQTVWKAYLPEAALSSLRGLAGLLLLGIGVDALVLSDNPLILYPLALLSAGGVLVVLTLAYTMLVIMFLGHENRYLHWDSLTLPMTGGFGLALAQIALLDLVRYLITHTWDGFHLG